MELKVYNVGDKLNLRTLPDRVKEKDFDTLVQELRKLVDKSKGIYQVSTYGDKFKIELDKAYGATMGTYGPVGGEFRTIKTIYGVPELEESLGDITEYKGFKIEHFPISWTVGKDSFEQDGYIIKSPYYLQSNEDKDKYYLPLYCEDENGEEINFKTIDEAKDYIDKYLATKKAKIKIKNRDEVHAVINESLKEDFAFYVNLKDINGNLIKSIGKNNFQDAYEFVKQYNTVDKKKTGLTASIEESLKENKLLKEDHEVDTYKGYEIDLNLDQFDVIKKLGEGKITVKVLKDGKEVYSAKGYDDAHTWIDKTVKENQKGFGKSVVGAIIKVLENTTSYTGKYPKYSYDTFESSFGDGLGINYDVTTGYTSLFFHDNGVVDVDYDLEGGSDTYTTDLSDVLDTFTIFLNNPQLITQIKELAHSHDVSLQISESVSNKKDGGKLLKENKLLNEDHQVETYRGYELDLNLDLLDKIKEMGEGRITIDISKDGKKVHEASGFANARKWIDTQIRDQIRRDINTIKGISLNDFNYDEDYGYFHLFSLKEGSKLDAFQDLVKLNNPEENCLDVQISYYALAMPDDQEYVEDDYKDSEVWVTFGLYDETDSLPDSTNGEYPDGEGANGLVFEYDYSKMTTDVDENGDPILDDKFKSKISAVLKEWVDWLINNKFKSLYEDMKMSNKKNLKEDIGASEIYTKLKAVCKDDEIDSHASDLYVKVKPETTQIINDYEHANQVTTFIDNITHTKWYEIPFVAPILKEEYGYYQGEVYCDRIAEYLEDGSEYGVVMTPYGNGEVEWELDINGHNSRDFECDEFFEYLLDDISYPVRDGHLSYIGLDTIIPNDSFNERFNKEDFKHDLEMLGVYDEESFNKFYSDEDYELEFWIDYDTNFDVDEWEELVEAEENEETEDDEYSIYLDKALDDGTFERLADANDLSYRETEDEIFIKGKKSDLEYFLDNINYEYDEDDLTLEESLKEGAEGKKEKGFEYIIYIAESDETAPIVGKRTTYVEAQNFANEYFKKKKVNCGIEKVPTDKFKVGDDFIGHFDADYNPIKESLNEDTKIENELESLPHVYMASESEPNVYRLETSWERSVRKADSNYLDIRKALEKKYGEENFKLKYIRNESRDGGREVHCVLEVEFLPTIKESVKDTLENSFEVKSEEDAITILKDKDIKFTDKKKSAGTNDIHYIRGEKKVAIYSPNRGRLYLVDEKLEESLVVNFSDVKHTYDGNIKSGDTIYTIVVFPQKGAYGQELLYKNAEDSFDTVYFNTPDEAKNFADSQYKDAYEIIIREESDWDAKIRFMTVSRPYLTRIDGVWKPHSNRKDIKEDLIFDYTDKDVEVLKDLVDKEKNPTKKKYLKHSLEKAEYETYDGSKKEESLNENSLAMDSHELSDGSEIKMGWDKNDGYYVEVIIPSNSGNGFYRTEKRRTFPTEERARNYYKRLVKQADKEVKIENLSESKTLNEGPGAGYSIKSTIEIGTVTDLGELRSIKPYKAETSYYNQDDAIVQFDAIFDCNISCSIDKLSAESAYYGDELEDELINGSISAICLNITDTIQGALKDKSTDEIDVESYAKQYLKKNEDFICKELSDRIIETSITYGGGYIHSTWDGTINTISDYVDDLGYKDTVVIEQADIKVLDKNIIKYVDKAVTGDNIYTEYVVYDNDYDWMESFDNEEAAIKFAKDHDAFKVIETFYKEDINGDSDIEDEETVWSKDSIDEYINEKFDGTPKLTFELVYRHLADNFGDEETFDELKDVAKYISKFVDCNYEDLRGALADQLWDIVVGLPQEEVNRVAQEIIDDANKGITEAKTDYAKPIKPKKFKGYKKGELGTFQKFDSGNMEINNAFFNMSMGANNISGVGTADGGVGAVSGGMGESIEESKMSELDIEVKNAGGKEEYLKQAEEELKKLEDYLDYLSHDAMREVGRGGNFDNQAEVEESLNETAEQISTLKTKIELVKDTRNI